MDGANFVNKVSLMSKGAFKELMGRKMFKCLNPTNLAVFSRGKNSATPVKYLKIVKLMWNLVVFKLPEWFDDRDRTSLYSSHHLDF